MKKADIEVLQSHMQYEYPHLNSGGCGLFAYIMTTIIPCKVLCLARPERISAEKIDITRELHKGGNTSKNSSFPHVIVKYRNMYFDGHRFIKVDFFGNVQDGRYQGYKVVQTMTKCEISCAILEGNWNDTFYDQWDMNRWDALQELKSFISKTISK